MQEIDKTDHLRDFLDRVDVVNIDADRARLLFQWEITEDIQEACPHQEFGWWGFVPLIINRWTY